MKVNKRDFLKQLGVGTLSVGSFTTITTGKESDEEPIETLSIEIAENEKREFLAFTSTDDKVVCLYLATGTSSVNEPADEIVQVTTPKEGSVLDIEWENPGTLRYWQNGAIHELAVSANGEIEQSRRVQTKAYPDEILPIKSNPSEKNTSTKPDSGSIEIEKVAPPSWMDDPQYDHDAIQKCQSADLGEICISTTKFSPKFYTNCYGNEIPLIGTSFNAASITTPAGGASIALDLWVGTDPNTNCLYWGSSMFNICQSNCNISNSPTPAEIENMFKDDLHRGFENLKDDINGVLDLAVDALKVVIDVLVVIAAIIFFLLIEFVTGGAIGS